MDAPLLLGGPYDGQRTKLREEHIQLQHYSYNIEYAANYLYVSGVYLFLGYTLPNT